MVDHISESPVDEEFDAWHDGETDGFDDET